MWVNKIGSFANIFLSTAMVSVMLYSCYGYEVHVEEQNQLIYEYFLMFITIYYLLIVFFHGYTR